MATDFEKRTLTALRECAKWLDDNAERLARDFSGGCRCWSVEFSAGEAGMFPEIDISVTKFDRSIMDAIAESYSDMQECDVIDYPEITEYR